MSRLLTRLTAVVVCGWVFLPPTRVPDIGTVILAIVVGLGIEAIGRRVAEGGLL